MTISSAASVNPWREAILDRLAVLCMDASQDEPPASILRRIIAAEVEIALDPSVSDVAPAAPVPDGWVMVPRDLLRRLIAEALTFDPSLQDKEAIEQAKQLAASPAAPAAPVVPLTDEQIDAIRANCWSHPGLGASFNYDKFARAIERAHGITGASK